MITEPRCSERSCRHFQGVKQDGEPPVESTERPVCAAFPDGIPDEIAYGDNLHLTVLHDQSNEIVFEPKRASVADVFGTLRDGPKDEPRDDSGKWTGGSESHATIHDIAVAGIDKSKITAKQKELAKARVKNVLKRMTPEMATAALENVKSVTVHRDMKALCNAVYPGEDRNNVTGYCSYDDKSIHFAFGVQQGGVSYAESMEGTIAHELGHAIDMLPEKQGGWKRSNDSEWGKSWREEIVAGSLTEYAKTSRQEGFAEYSRLVVQDKGKAESKYPKCWAFWKKQGLV